MAGLLICWSQETDLHFGTKFVKIGAGIMEIPRVESKSLVGDRQNRPELEAVALCSIFFIWYFGNCVLFGWGQKGYVCSS